MKQMMINGKMPVILLAALSLLFSACSKEGIDFDGSRTSNETQFILDFETLNISLSHTMDLEAQDVVDVKISKSRGVLDIEVADMEGNPVYRGDNASPGEFSIVISSSDIYEFIVTGRNASGYVSFIKR